MKFSKFASTIAFASIASMTVATVAQAEVADETRYPVIFAHGMMGWDSLAGYNYFGEDGWGTFVGDSCQFMELNGCNDWISSGQQAKAEAFAVSAFNSSEVRGEELYNHVRSFLASTGYSKVNFISHSQGGFDMRKAAHRLKNYYGTVKVGAMISVSSPHRGTSYAKRILDAMARNTQDVFCGALPPAPNGDNPCLTYVDEIIDVLFDGIAYVSNSGTAPNDAIAGALQLIYDDYDAGDNALYGVTGAKAFNQNYPMAGVSSYVGSVVTGQDDGSLNPLLSTLHALINHNADGDGACADGNNSVDCDNDGAAGRGNGTVYDMDDDGLVPINSQQIGYRLQYNPNDYVCDAYWLGVCWNSHDPLDSFSEVSTTGYVSDVNTPSSTQMTSHAGTLSQDHLDVFSIGPDTLDEEEFYAGLMDFIYTKGF